MHSIQFTQNPPGRASTGCSKPARSREGSSAGELFLRDVRLSTLSSVGEQVRSDARVRRLSAETMSLDIWARVAPNASKLALLSDDGEMADERGTTRVLTSNFGSWGERGDTGVGYWEVELAGGTEIDVWSCVMSADCDSSTAIVRLGLRLATGVGCFCVLRRNAGRRVDD